jgi:tetratricopeptide (TPR) repeat protein
MTDPSFEKLFRKGTELLHRGLVDEALALLEAAYKVQPEHADVGLNLGGAYILTKRFKQAIPILEVLIEQEPENVMVWTNLGAAYLGNPILANEAEQVKAIAALEAAFKINPAAPHVAYNIGLIYRDRREFDDAMYWFKKAIKANPADRDARSLLAKLEEGEG